MAHERFLDQGEQPTLDQIRKRIGKEVLPVWGKILNEIKERFPEYQSEWVFYSGQHGWANRFRKESTQLCLLFPERGSFSALITLNPEEETAALEKLNFFNARIRQLLSSPSNLPQGRWLWVRLEDHTDFVGVMWLLEIKAA